MRYPSGVFDVLRTPSISRNRSWCDDDDDDGDDDDDNDDDDVVVVVVVVARFNCCAIVAQVSNSLHHQ
jgi:hypothetical protein